ncbi:hypothetical protein TrLO_g3511 [Triparma laevis f. longispina]|uniref:Uncharacterized protein n=1 Tax=Triparma laevis f. longispina TaxID=1714387 RepID=A0A9W7F9Z0_9STRA|nr:hypothetical protein TrLO_g3511 [Triparma laevis f. longispina]
MSAQSSDLLPALLPLLRDTCLVPSSSSTAASLKLREMVSDVLKLYPLSSSESSSERQNVHLQIRKSFETVLEEITARWANITTYSPDHKAIKLQRRSYLSFLSLLYDLLLKLLQKNGGTTGYNVLVCAAVNHLTKFGGAKGEGLLQIGNKHSSFVKKAIENFIGHKVVTTEIGDVWRKQFSVQEGEKIDGDAMPLSGDAAAIKSDDPTNQPTLKDSDSAKQTVHPPGSIGHHRQILFSLPPPPKDSGPPSRLPQYHTITQMLLNFKPSPNATKISALTSYFFHLLLNNNKIPNPSRIVEPVMASYVLACKGCEVSFRLWSLTIDREVVRGLKGVGVEGVKEEEMKLEFPEANPNFDLSSNSPLPPLVYKNNLLHRQIKPTPTSTAITYHLCSTHPIASPSLISAYEYVLLNILNFNLDIKSSLPNYYIQKQLVMKTISKKTLQSSREFMKTATFLNSGVCSLNDPVNILLAVCAHCSKEDPSPWILKLACSHVLIKSYQDYFEGKRTFQDLWNVVKGVKEEKREGIKRKVERELGDVPEKVREMLVEKRVEEEGRKKRRFSEGK